MDDEGFEIVRHKRDKECAPGLHSDVPIIEGDQTVGLVCTICGRRVREAMEYSYLVVSPEGLIDTRERPPSRKDPRF